MNERLRDVLEGKEANYILPLYWQHGEDESVLREEMARIYESGIRAVCVEARPHPDYLGPGWWRDIDAIMEEARARGMRVWVLDDDHFPTGRAAGKLMDASKELRRSFLSERHIDAIGPAPHAAFLVESPPYIPGFSENGGGTLIGVVACKRDAHGVLNGEALDLTPLVKDGALHWSVPEGYWRIFILCENDKGGSREQEDYLNPLVAESTRVLIDTVYEAFYERYRDDFGKTLAGFFSDEPGFYNDKTTYNFDSGLGKKGVSLPWSPEVPKRLEEALGPDYPLQLPLLWHDSGSTVPPIRYHYMNIVSRLYADNFAGQIGDWCRQRGVEYIGHVLEDNNVHARLGCGPGHFFRALWGQDMAGIDVVLWQLAPGFDEVPFRWVAGEADSEFFNYGLAKMASSLAHLDPKKKGRTMAEVFGAYGWAEGLKLMKWLTDHMLVRGVNHFVPHAFSPKEFPDPDCPPHLYARGRNPQFRYYRYLNDYTNRLSHLLSGGAHVASAAVLYHAEAEWSGEAMYFHKPVKALMKRQIDCDVLSVDAILETAAVRDRRLYVQGESFDCLIVPYSEALPAACLKRLAELAQTGLPVWFVNGLPVRSSEGEDVISVLSLLSVQPSVCVVKLDELADRMREAGFYDISVASEQPYLRYYHIRHADLDVYFFFNEHPRTAVDTVVEIPNSGNVVFYDAYENRLLPAAAEAYGGKVRLRLRLAPFETIVAAAGPGIGNRSEEGAAIASSVEIREIPVSGPWTVSLAAPEQYPDFTAYGTIEPLSDLSRPDALPRFSGTFRYEAAFEWREQDAAAVRLELGEVYETAEIRLNGRPAGVRISFPYRVEVSGLLVPGTNILTIEVTNTLVKEQRDIFSLVAQQEPSGLLGPVRFIVERQSEGGPGSNPISVPSSGK